MSLIIYFYSQIVSHVVNHEKTLREQVCCSVDNLTFFTPPPEIYKRSTANEKAHFLDLKTDCTLRWLDTAPYC